MTSSIQPLSHPSLLVPLDLVSVILRHAVISRVDKQEFCFARAQLNFCAPTKKKFFALPTDTHFTISVNYNFWELIPIFQSQLFRDSKILNVGDKAILNAISIVFFEKTGQN